MLGWIEVFFNVHFVRDEKAVAANAGIRVFAKAVLEFVRNLLVVVIITVLAQKSESWIVSGLALITCVALWSTVYSYIDPWGPRVNTYRWRWQSWAVFSISALAMIGLVLTLSTTLNLFILKLAALQANK